MQTFLPTESFEDTAKVLDRQRLGKQRVETLQILNCLIVKPTRWKNHPAVKMWEGYEACLVYYGLTICYEWINRGYKDTCFNKIRCLYPNWRKEIINPPWLGLDKFHSSHKSKLLSKKPEWYSQFGWTEPNNLPYFWPTINANL